MRLKSILLILIATALCAHAQAPAAAPQNSTTLQVDGDTVTITRDTYGVPHVFASTPRGLFYGNGYAIAQDRLWQMERYRHDARGRMAELEGKAALPRDWEVRRLGYTSEQYRKTFDGLDAEMRAVYEAYRDGVNAWMEKAATEGKLPENYGKLSLKPEPWDVTDSVTIGVVMAHRFGSGGGRELNNLRLLNKLKAKFGDAEAQKIFDDFYWRNDPRSPATITEEDMKKPRVGSPPIAAAVPVGNLDDTALATAAARAEMREVLAYNAAHDLPTKWGSYAWVVGPKRSVSGKPLLVGGPQMGFTTPQIAHEVHLGGAGFDVIGMGFAGIPGVLIGHNKDLAWTTTSGIGDMIDVFAEKLDPQDKRRYMFKGQSRAAECRQEVFKVRGGDDISREVCRTVHGPILELDEKAGIAYSLSASFEGHEIDSMRAFLGYNRARTAEEVGKNVSLIWLSHNFFAADKNGNIGYWMAGKLPLRLAGHDPRLPLPGTGEAEWRGRTTFDTTPQVLNPARGYIVNWNNKPASWYDNVDGPVWGEIFRIHRINKLIEARPKHTVETMRQIIADIGLNDPNADYLKPHIVSAVDRSRPQDAELARAAEYLRAWDNHAEEESIGKTIFDAWLEAARDVLFKDDFGDLLDRGTYAQLLQPSLILHLLDGQKSGVPPKHDFLKGRTHDQVVLEALRRAVAELKKKSPDMSAWGYHGRSIDFRPLPPMPATNRGTYIQIVVVGDTVRGVSILPPGQSEDPKSPHFGDQREPAALWRFKPMVADRALLEK